MKSIQYTVRNIPSKLDSVLRERMRTEGLSLNATLCDALMRGAGLGGEGIVNHDFDDLAGKWVVDEPCEEVLEGMRATIDEDLWR